MYNYFLRCCTALALLGIWNSEDQWDAMGSPYHPKGAPMGAPMGAQWGPMGSNVSPIGGPLRPFGPIGPQWILEVEWSAIGALYHRMGAQWDPMSHPDALKCAKNSLPKVDRMAEISVAALLVFSRVRFGVASQRPKLRSVSGRL